MTLADENNYNATESSAYMMRAPLLSPARIVISNAMSCQSDKIIISQVLNRIFSFCKVVPIVFFSVEPKILGFKSKQKWKRFEKWTFMTHM